VPTATRYRLGTFRVWGGGRDSLKTQKRPLGNGASGGKKGKNGSKHCGNVSATSGVGPRPEDGSVGKLCTGGSGIRCLGLTKRGRFPLPKELGRAGFTRKPPKLNRPPQGDFPPRSRNFPQSHAKVNPNRTGGPLIKGTSVKTKVTRERFLGKRRIQWKGGDL